MLKLLVGVCEPSFHTAPNAPHFTTDPAAQRSSCARTAQRSRAETQNYQCAPLHETVECAFDTLFSGLRTGQSRTAQEAVVNTASVPNTPLTSRLFRFPFHLDLEIQCFWMICPLHVIHETSGGTSLSQKVNQRILLCS